MPCTGDGCPTTTTTEPSTTTTAPATTTTEPETTTSTVATNVLGEQFNRPSGSAATGPLAFTGGVVDKLFIVGLALMLMGIVVMGHRARGALASRD